MNNKFAGCITYFCVTLNSRNTYLNRRNCQNNVSVLLIISLLHVVHRNWYILYLAGWLRWKWIATWKNWPILWYKPGTNALFLFHKLTVLLAFVFWTNFVTRFFARSRYSKWQMAAKKLESAAKYRTKRGEFCDETPLIFVFPKHQIWHHSGNHSWSLKKCNEDEKQVCFTSGK